MSVPILNPLVRLSNVIGATPVINILSTTISVPSFKTSYFRSYLFNMAFLISFVSTPFSFYFLYCIKKNNKIAMFFAILLM